MMSSFVVNTRVVFIVVDVCLLMSCVQSGKRWGPGEDYYDFDEEIEKEIPCSDPGPIANGETIVWGDGLLLEYRCKASYSAVGITHGACDLSTGTWTIEPPVCVDGGCPSLTAPTHGVINLDTSGGLASFVCRPGYFLLGDSALVCEEGKWKGTYPLCAGTAKPNEKTKSRKDSGQITILKNSMAMPDISIDDSDETCFYNQISPPDIEYAVVETNYVLNELRQRYIMVATYTCMGGYKLRNSTNKQLFCKNLIWTAQTLPECIADDDPCEIDNGGCHHYCTPHGGHKHSCSCYGGYNLEKDAKTCHDTDECSIDNGGCEHECLNTEGSFFCTCAAGFVPKGPNCVDIDECEKKEDQCPGPCINSPGSFQCDCNITGYMASQTTLDHCEDIDECAEHNGGCDDVCSNKRGTFECRCETKGRKLGEDGRSCVDVDECSRYKSKVCVNGHCTNTDGSFTCTCNSGYKQARNLSFCEDVDECEANNGGCAQLCENKAGSFSCACHKGFSLADDNINCKDINECLVKNGGCDDVCVNKIGFYKCGCSHIGKVLSQDGRSCKECLPTQYFNRSTSSCNSCPQNAHARDPLALSVKDCRCDRGFHGNPSLNLECQDINECQTGQMKCSHKCVNTIGSAYCTCPKGLSAQGDELTCQDIDECELATHNCSQLCYNTQGSYTCACQGGFILDKDGQTCNDIDECTKDTTLCSQNCTNTDGGYICVCHPGYQLGEDGITCEDVNECLQDQSPCEQICTNTIGSYICSCDGLGFKLSRDQMTCIDINECMEGDNPCPNICINTIGSFLCDCDRSGYILASDASGCEDINECSSNPCPHKCINTPGSYKCVCPAGFSDPPENNQTVCNECPFGTYRGKEDSSCRRCPPRTNTTSTGSESIKSCFCVSGYQSDPLGSGLCLDINECTTGALQCEHSCVNTEGSAHCTCKPGFILDPNGVTCKDTNECAKHNGGCEHNCVNTPGSFYCECRGKNYKLAENGLSCEDVNECNLPNHGCEYRCINTPNGAKCTCPPGHELLGDGQKCKDIDECRSRNGGCTDTCINTPGSYRCECQIPGYKLYTDNKQCVDRNECEEDKQACDDMCVNTPGSFKCYCRQNGFALAGDKRTCEDIDECAKGKICQQVCINLPGSFRCDCEAGYFKQGHHCTACLPGTYRGKRDSVISCQPCPSGMTTSGKATDSILGCFCPAGYHGNPETQDKCEDMNECVKNNGGCQHICNNMNGSFFCSCSEGYILQSDKRKCAPTRCPILNPPKFAKFIGKGCLKMSKGQHVDPGTECMYQCRKYMMLHGPEKRTCLENFTWSGKDPECLARPCERLPVPENGYLYPPLCMLPRVPFRTRCIYKCNRGYESSGRPGAKCKANNKWSGKGLHHCVAKRRKRNV